MMGDAVETGMNTSSMRIRQDYSSVVFFVGLGALFIMGWWWPGILLVIALTSIARAHQRGQGIFSSGHIFLIGLVVAFTVDSNYFLAALLIALGLSQLPQFQRRRRKTRTRERKDQKRKAKAGDESDAGAPSLEKLIAESGSDADGEYDDLDDWFDEPDETNEERR